MAWSKDKFNYTAKKIRDLNENYLEIARIKEKMYGNLIPEERIDILLAKRSVFVFRVETIEEILSHKVIGGKMVKSKMGAGRRSIIEDYIYSLKNIIMKCDDVMHTMLNSISKNDSQKDSIRAKLGKAKIYPQPYGCEFFDLNFIDQIADKQDPLEFIMLKVILRNLHSAELVSMQKHLTKLHNTPRSNDNEKAYFVYYLHELRKEYIENDKQACEIYFRHFPTDHRDRKEVRKRILDCRMFFPPAIYSILYDPLTDDPAVWWNFQELTTPDRELQFIARELVSHIDAIRKAHGPILRSKELSIASEILWLSYASILINIDITEFIRTSPHLPHANDRINDIPPDVFEERKELFEEIVKTRCWEYIYSGFCFPLAVWSNATTCNSGSHM